VQQRETGRPENAVKPARMPLVSSTEPNLVTARRTALFVVAIGYAVVLAVVLGQWQMALIGGITGMVLSFSDDDGALASRLAMLAMVTAAALAGGILGHFVGVSALFWPLFLAAAFAAGWLYRSARGPQLAGRIFAISLSIIAGAPTMTVSRLELLASVVAVCVLARVIDHLLFGPLPRGPAARSPGAPSTTAQWLAFALVYATCATLGFAIGFAIEPTRAIWVSITTLVVMQPDDARNYRRILERVAGTAVGVLAAFALTLALHTPDELAAAMLVVAALLPHQLGRRYWLFTALIALLVLLAYAAATAAGTDHDTMTALFVARLADVSLGAILALIGTAIVFPPWRKGHKETPP
jgi:Fusaric acid resistance protein-like